MAAGTDAFVGSGFGPGFGPGPGFCLSSSGQYAPDTAQLLRAAFAEAASDVTPPPVPLEAIERDGRRRRRRRRATALSAGCGLLLIPLAALALRPDGPSTGVRPMAPTAPGASASPSPTRPPAPIAGKARVVAPGERVHVGDGTRIWLTEEGKHWDEPKVSDIPEFRSVVDGNLDTSRPGASVQETSWGSDYAFLSGVYYGGRTVAAGAEIELHDGRKLHGTVLRLAGNEEWGAWYVRTDIGEGVSHADHMRGLTRKVTVYDVKGAVVASSRFGD
ncbi:hypothetical protein WBG99_16950 [Streptomyces sp. TG1A-60]|uniref:hypothetical protein n=1 Tax=Streptomyces sp. TG1A-60 TaxID=3129111 RepID=UPI0030D33563